jgi:hypothetical protein
MHVVHIELLHDHEPLSPLRKADLVGGTPLPSPNIAIRLEADITLLADEVTEQGLSISSQLGHGRLLACLVLATAVDVPSHFEELWATREAIARRIASLTSFQTAADETTDVFVPNASRI